MYLHLFATSSNLSHSFFNDKFLNSSFILVRMEGTDSSFIHSNHLKSLESSTEYAVLPKSLQEIFKTAFITNCNFDHASVTEDELQTLEDLDQNEVIDNIKNLIDTLLQFKSNCKSASIGELATRCDQLEKMLQKQESEVRGHITLEHQLKLHIDSIQQKVIDLESALSEAQVSIKEMEGRGLENMKGKLQKVEAKFQSEMDRVIKDYKEGVRNEAKNNEKIRKLEEMYEKKEKAYVRLQLDFNKMKEKLEETLQEYMKVKTGNRDEREKSFSGEIKMRRSSYNEEMNHGSKVAGVYGGDYGKSKMSLRENIEIKVQGSKFKFNNDNSVEERHFVEPIPPPLELKHNQVGKFSKLGSRKHVRSSSDCVNSLSSRKCKTKR